MRVKHKRGTHAENMYDARRASLLFSFFFFLSGFSFPPCFSSFSSRRLVFVLKIVANSVFEKTVKTEHPVERSDIDEDDLVP